MRLRQLATLPLLLFSLVAAADDGLIDLSAKPPEKVWLTDDVGATTLVSHPWGAFPDGNLSRTGEGQGRRRIPASAYRDDSTLVYVPYDLKPQQPIQLLVHLHGWRGLLTGDRPISESQHLRETVLCSQTNTILVVPQGPSNVKSSRFGNLESVEGFTAFLTHLPEVLPPGVLPDGWLNRVDRVAVSGHSGGGSPIAKLLWDGRRYDDGGGTPKERWAWDRLSTVILFDATYSGEGSYSRWWAAKDGRKLKSYYRERTSTAPVSLALAKLADEHPDRGGDLTVEGFTADEMPEPLRGDSHYSIPWYRLWDGLGAESGKCPWSDRVASVDAD